MAIALKEYLSVGSTYVSGTSSISQVNTSNGTLESIVYAAGDFAVFAINLQSNTNTISSVTDSLGNTYTLAAIVSGTGSVGNGGSPGSTVIYYLVNAIAGTTTISVDGGTSTWGVVGATYSGVPTNATVDQTGTVNNQTSLSSSASVSTTGATTQSNELVFAAYADSYGFSHTNTVDTNYTSVGGMGVPGDIQGEYSATNTAGVQTATYTMEGGTYWQMVIATFAASGSTNVTIASSISGSSSETATISDSTSVGGSITGSSSMLVSMGSIFAVTSTIDGSSAMTGAISNTEPVRSAITGSSSETGTLSNSTTIASTVTGSSSMTATFPVTGGAYDSTVLGLNPEAYWKLNDAAGSTTVADSSGNSYTGTLGTSGITLGGASAIPSEPSETSLTTTGATFVATSSAPQSSVVAWSASAWFNTSSTTPQMVITGDRGSSGSGLSLTLSMGNSYPGGPGSVGDISFGVDSNALYEGVYTTNTFNDGNWHFVVATWAAASGASISGGQFAIYVDGVAQSTTYISVNYTGDSINSPLSGLGGIYLGDNGVVGSGYWNFWDGSLAQIALFTTQLSSTDVTNLWNASQNTGITIASVITGSSSATSTISDAESLAFSISGSSSLSATIIDNESMSTAITGSSSMSAAITDADFIVANLSGASSVTAVISDAETLSSSISGSSAVATTLVDNTTIASSENGSSSMTVSITDADSIVASISGTSSMSSAIDDTASIASSLSGSSAVSASIEDADSIVASISGSSSMVAGFSGSTYTITSTIDGSSSASASITDNESIASSLIGFSTMTSAITDADTMVANLSGSSTLNVTMVDDTTVSVSITGSSNVTATFIYDEPISVTITGSSSMASEISDEEFIQGLFTGSSSTSAAINDADTVSVVITGSSSMTAVITDTGSDINAQISGSSSMTGTLSDEEFIEGLFAGSSSMTAIFDVPLTASISGSSSITATLFNNNNQPLSVQQIYDILNPEWWSYSLNAWNTGYISTQINYKNNIVYNYLSTEPIQNYGINEGNTGIDIPLQVESLRLAAAQALADLQCTEILGYTKLNGNQIAGAQQ